jgi:hypothetical protein
MLHDLNNTASNTALNQLSNTNKKCQHVPIPSITNRCRFGCCERTFCPLKLSFAKTIGAFQGQNAGPVDEGKPPNPVKTIICDPGSREFEAQKPGLFYSIISRGTAPQWEHSKMENNLDQPSTSMIMGLDR